MLPFWLSIGALGLVQAALVTAPRQPLRRGRLPILPLPPVEHLRSSWWALILPLSIGVVVGAIALEAETARFLTYLALAAVPPLAALALGGLARGARPPLALLALPLFALAWADKGALAGDTAALALSALACVSLAWLLGCVVAERWLKLGIYAMAAIDAWLVGGDLLQGPNATLNAATPVADLPRLQFAHFGSAVMGFGDLFIAAVLGAILARNRGQQLRGALLVAAYAVLFDLLFFAVDELPATIPIALALATLEISNRLSRERGSASPSRCSRRP